MSTTYRIAEVADRSGFTPATLRYYEDRGLLAPVGRTEAGYRLYDDAAVERLRFIARAKQLGSTLDEVADLSAAWEGGRCEHVQERLLALVEAKVADTHRRIAELTALAADLQRAAATLAAGATGATGEGPCDDTCGCLADPGTGPSSADGPRAAVPVPLVTRPVAVSGPPVACTLGPGEMPGRLEEWDALLAGVTAREAVEGGLPLAFGPGADGAELARLATAEQACCPFFSFAVVVDDRGLALEVRAPADAADVVAAVFGAPGR